MDLKQLQRWTYQKSDKYSTTALLISIIFLSCVNRIFLLLNKPPPFFVFINSHNFSPAYIFLVTSEYSLFEIITLRELKLTKLRQ